jgi:hypothetical protein
MTRRRDLITKPTNSTRLFDAILDRKAKVTVDI